MKVTQHGNNFVFTTDITAQRHRGSETSIAANPTVQAKRDAHEKILGLLRFKNLTAKEIAVAMGKTLNAISGRCSELRAMGKVSKTGVRREGSAELRIV